jgi:catabolite regulation protein CreA
MKKLLLALCISYNCFSLEQEQKRIIEIEEVFTPIQGEDPYIILDINDPKVQEVIKRVVSASIHEAFKNKELEKELANKNKCCTSTTKLKIALLTALSSTATAVITIILNNK